MTDREMLELAAKAAGYYFHGLRVGLDYENCFVSTTNDTDDWIIWDPLTDDGDALRLAVQLMIRVSVNRAFPLGIPGIPGSVTAEYPDRDCFYFALGEAVTNGDPYAATRRAITRAAAEIGRQMEVTK
jgi:hypothetical protein